MVNCNLPGKRYSIFDNNFDKMEEATLWLAAIKVLNNLFSGYMHGFQVQPSALFRGPSSDVAALLRSHMIGLLPFESTIEQTTETMPLALKQ